MKLEAIRSMIPSNFSVPGGREVVQGVAKMTVIALSAMTIKANNDEECALTKSEADKGLEFGAVAGVAVCVAVVALGYAWFYKEVQNFSAGH